MNVNEGTKEVSLELELESWEFDLIADEAAELGITFTDCLMRLIKEGMNDLK